MRTEPLSGAKREIIEFLKVQGPSTAAAIAQRLGVTEVAVRQHLQGLADAKFVVGRSQAPEGRGRPAVDWELTEKARTLFPDSHGTLTVELLQALRTALGEPGLNQVLASRASEQARRYRTRMPQSRSLRAKVQGLADLRSAEGYMAEVVTEGRGRYLLIEHHCPICEAAQACLKLCGSELEVFREVLGPNVLVERTEHLPSGDRRCAYRIEPSPRLADS